MPPKRTSSKCGSDADVARSLLVWCRMQRYHVGEIRVGDVTLAGLADLSTVAPAVPTGADAGATDYREQFGGAGLARFARDGKNAESATLEEDDE